MKNAEVKSPVYYFRLDEEAWIEIGAAYMAGATGSALGRKWKVSPGTIYRQAKLRGWSKRRHASAVVRASHPPAAAAPSEGEPAGGEPHSLIAYYAADEMIDPGLVAQIATTASGWAVMRGRFDEAFVLAQIALTHARIAKLRPESERAVVLRMLSHPKHADALFSESLRDGEAELKSAYWALRRDERHRSNQAAAALAAAQARIAALEEAAATPAS